MAAKKSDNRGKGYKPMRLKPGPLLWLLFSAFLSSCNLNLSGAAGTPAAVITPTLTSNLASPTSTPETRTPVPATSTPTFPPVITATPPPATATSAATITATPAPGVKIDVIKMLNAKSGWAVGQFISNTTDDILKTADGGANWKPVTPPEPNRSGKHAAAFFQDINRAWVTYSPISGGTTPTQFTVWRTTDGGASWKPTSTSLSGLTMDGFTTSQIGFSDANNGWLMSVLGAGMNHTYFALYKSSNGGGTWNLVVSPDKNNANMSCSKSGAWFRDANHGFLAGNCFGVVKGLYLYATNNGGDTWSQVNLPPPPAMTDAFTSESVACGADTPYFFDQNNGMLMVTCSNMNNSKTNRWIFRTPDGGTTWSSSPMPRPFGGTFFLTPQKGWYLGQTAVDAFSGVNVYQTTDGGKNWKQISGTQWGGEMDYVDDNNGWVIARSTSGQAFVRTINGGLSYALLIPHLAP
jgi:photosystem II stability/assembly factor-like uncharacterized protein